jgi:hypothetical protein
LQYEANEQADLLAFKQARARKSRHQPTTVPLTSVLAQYFQALPLSEQQQFLLTVTHQHIELAVVEADIALVMSGNVPFWRLDCYRSWFLAHGYSDLFAQLRQSSSVPAPALPADADLRQVA